MTAVSFLITFSGWLANTSSAQADSSTMIACRTQPEGSGVKIVIDADGAAKITLAPSRVCGLKIQDFDYQPAAVVPTARFDFRRVDCTPELDAILEKEILKSMNLIVSIARPDATTATLQWNQHQQPTPCKIVIYKPLDVRFAADRFKKHQWPSIAAKTSHPRGQK